MKPSMRVGVGLVAAILVLATARVATDEIKVAVASNFIDAIREITRRFEQQTSHKVILVSGSTGRLYAQIKNGAPFDAFFSADVRRARMLELEGAAQPGSRITYAMGKLVLWSPDEDVVDQQGRVLEQGDFRYLALANPKLAPYGRAAREVLENRSVWRSLQHRMVRGENIGQAYQFVKSGNAELGLVARSQVKRPGKSISGSYWEIPQTLYSPIEQQAVLLQDHAAARAFMDFVRTEAVTGIIRAYGYETH